VVAGSDRGSMTSPGGRQ